MTEAKRVTPQGYLQLYRAAAIQEDKLFGNWKKAAINYVRIVIEDIILCRREANQNTQELELAEEYLNSLETILESNVAETYQKEAYQKFIDKINTIYATDKLFVKEIGQKIEEADSKVFEFPHSPRALLDFDYGVQRSNGRILSWLDGTAKYTDSSEIPEQTLIGSVRELLSDAQGKYKRVLTEMLEVLEDIAAEKAKYDKGIDKNLKSTLLDELIKELFIVVEECKQFEEYNETIQNTRKDIDKHTKLIKEKFLVVSLDEVKRQTSTTNKFLALSQNEVKHQASTVSAKKEVLNSVIKTVPSLNLGEVKRQTSNNTSGEKDAPVLPSECVRHR